jgi:peptide/nickel transport system substrate-binding protein
MNKSILLKIFSAIFVLSLLLAACGTPATQAPAEQPAAEEPAAEEPAAEEPAAEEPAAEEPAAEEPAAEEPAAEEPMGEPTRAETFVLTLWSDTGGSIPGFDNWSPVMNAGGALRGNGGNIGMSEGLFYRNLNNGEETPWLAESYGHNEDFTQWTMKLREGVEWSDGEAFNCADVKFTLDMLVANAPDMQQSSYFKEWIKDVSCTDDFNLVINLNKPYARFMYPLVIGWEYHFAVVPEHIWKDVADPKTFTFYDPEKGWPIFTGPYKLTSTSATQVVLDRRDDWWAIKTGFVSELPAPRRIITIPFASDDLAAQKYITNEIDYGGPLLIGTFQAANAQNPKLIPWYPPDNKILGAPDGCLYDLIMNNQKPLFADKNVRLALNYATDRQQVVDLAYLGSTVAKVVPFSEYIYSTWVTGDLKAAIDSYDRMTPSPDKVTEYMTAAGYVKNDAGIWEKDGQTAKFTIITPSWLAPIGPVLTEQYTQAGFEVTEEPDRTNTFGNALTTGTFDAMVFVFCGSNFEPYDTLSMFHSKMSAPEGESVTNGMAGWRYGNPEMDAAVDAMQAMFPNKDDPAYVEQVIKATKIYLEDMPAIVLADELHVIPGNHTYWTGFPNSENPYVAPFPCWRDIFLMTLNLKPAQ